MSQPEGPYLGPRRNWEQDRTRRHKPWHRQLPWLVPTVACGVFLFLIVGVLSVRTVILRRSKASAGPSASNEQISKSETLEAKPTVASAAPPTSGQNADVADLQVLPPAAAKQPGRKLPKMLLVGDLPNMFPSIEEALKFSTSGDVIEIRTNRPLTVRKAVYVAKDEQNGDSLTFRAGSGLQPVLGCGDVSMFEFTNTRVTLERLHFTGPLDASFQFFIFREGGGLTARECTFAVNLPLNHFGHVAWFGGSAKGPDDHQVLLQRCFLRGSRIGLLTNNGTPVASLEMSNCLAVTFGPVFTSYLPGTGNRLTLRNNTLLIHHLLVLGDDDGLPHDITASVVAKSNVILAFELLSYSHPKKRDPRLRVGSQLIWGGRGNLFSPSTLIYPDFAMVRAGVPGENYLNLPFDLSQWNAFWGGGAETDSEIGDMPLVKPIDMANVWKSPPSDYELRPVGAVERLARRDIYVGCDVSKIPIPPAATLEPYDP